MKTLAMVAALLLAASSTDPELTVYPRGLLAGGTVHLTCRVPRDERHRLIVLGIPGVHTSEWDLNDYGGGAKAPITWESWERHIPCGAPVAVCAVIEGDGHLRETSKELVVAGCD